VTARFSLFVLRRAVTSLVLVVSVASAAHLLAGLAPGDHLSEFEMTPEQLQAERHRVGLDRPLHERYADWLQRALQLDLGESVRYPGRTVSSLIGERLGNSLRLGALALMLATLIGIPLGVLAGTDRRRPHLVAARAANILLLSLPPVVLSLALLFVAARTGWFPVGGLPPGDTLENLRYFVLPVMALGLPVAASLERLQSRSIAQALRHPSVLAARARGIPERRIVWGHAFKLSLTPVLAIYGVIVGALISGSFVVEYVMTWPGLGRLMYDGLIARDANVVAGCAATGAACLAAGVFISDVLLAAVDPRRGDAA
jgi:ABC-type dipeptide/oligopeptide/nickel transport system permease component